MAGYQNRDKLAEMLKGTNLSGSSGTQPSLSGLLGNLSGGNTSVAGFLQGGLGELLNRFNQNGQADIAQSWVSSGPNKSISPQSLQQAIGPDVLSQLEQQTGLTEQEIVARLSRELPEAVDRYTPDGRLPAG
jgi:uncharacterized protein YidB (DUF937 family)